jgi:hypothetical protein
MCARTAKPSEARALGQLYYVDALAAVCRGLERFPDRAGLNYNYACFATLAGEVDDEMFASIWR